MFTNSNHVNPCLRQQSHHFSDRHLKFSILTQTKFLKQRRCFVQPSRVVTAKSSFFNVIQIELNVRSPTSHGLDCFNIVDSIIPKTYFFDSVGGKLFKKRCGLITLAPTMLFHRGRFLIVLLFGLRFKCSFSSGGSSLIVPADSSNK